jgi:hypothetical protein
MFIGCTWLNHKPYDNFEGHNIPCYGVGYIEKTFFWSILLIFLYPWGLELQPLL